MEALKKLCPINIIKNLGAEAIWLYSAAQKVRETKIADLDQQEAFWAGEEIT